MMLDQLENASSRKEEDQGYSPRWMASLAFNSCLYRVKGTVWESPELWKDETSTRTRESDVWAFGCVALEVQMNTLPWDPKGNLRVVMNRQIKGGYPAQKASLNLGDDEVLQKVWGMMIDCWQLDPQERPSLSSLAVRLQRLVEC
ncbi:Tyrosine kinase domain protein [Ceratobasidium sp. AG-Ba]|nr:Tyrosine kinase domain protein [Ceratobasidium sp. AG-Ba]